jgi:hypothetical protein
MLAFLRWLVINSVFVGFIILGTVYDVAGARNASIFFVWVFAVLSLGMASEKVKKSLVEKKNWPSVPLCVEITFDVSILILLSWYGWFVTAGAYAVQACIMYSAVDDVTKMRKAAAQSTEPEKKE